MNLAQGDIESVIKSIRLIKSDTIWMNLASTCIKLKKIKLARMCLGKLKNAKALRTICADRKDMNNMKLAPEYALHLGRFEDAKELWSESENSSELNNFYQVNSRLIKKTAQWEKALETAALRNRTSLPVTYFEFANSLIEAGDIAGAIAAFEKSNTTKY